MQYIVRGSLFSLVGSSLVVDRWMGWPPHFFSSFIVRSFPLTSRHVVTSLHVSGLTYLTLLPQVGYAQPVLAALERLEQAGVEDEDVTLVSVVISKDALETLTTEVEDMKVVSERGQDAAFPPKEWRV